MRETQNKWCTEHLDETSDLLVSTLGSFEDIPMEEPLVKDFLSGAEMCISNSIQLRIQRFIADIKEEVEIITHKAKSDTRKHKTVGEQWMKLLKHLEEDTVQNNEQKTATQEALRECKKYIIQTFLLSVMERRNAQIYETVYNAMVEMLNSLPMYNVTTLE